MTRKHFLVGVSTIVMLLAGFATTSETAAAVDTFGPFVVKVDIDGRRTARVDDVELVDAFRSGQSVGIRCQDWGEPAGGSAVWDNTSAGLWVPDAYLKTGSEDFLTGVPRCSAIGISGAVPNARTTYPAKVAIDGRGSKNLNDRVKIDAYLAGAGVPILCQELGPSVSGNRVWNLTTDNYWVPDYYVDTGVNGFAPGIPNCSAFAKVLDDMSRLLGGGYGPYPAKVAIDGRGSAVVTDRVKVDAYLAGARVSIRCQDAGSEVLGNTVWDYTVDGYWVPDAYLTTGVNGYLAGVPRCGAIGMGSSTHSGASAGPFPAKVAIDGRGTPDPADRIKVDAYRAGQAVYLQCQQSGVAVNGNSVWGFTREGYWIPDTYIQTGVEGFLPGVARCSEMGVVPKAGNGAFGPFAAKVTLDGRSSINPEVRSKVDAYLAGTGVYIRCQDLGPMVDGSAIWDHTTDGYWVPDTYLRTGTDDWLSYVPRCGSVGIAGGGGGLVSAKTASETRARILTAARSKVGFAEYSDNCNPFGLNGVRCGAAWCTMFATWSWRQAGVDVRFDYSGDLWQWGRRNGLLRAKSEVRPGDIVIYGNGAGAPVHTGVVESVSSTGRITTVEGNYKNAVTRVAGINPFSPNPPHTYSRVLAVVAPVHDEHLASQPVVEPAMPGATQFRLVYGREPSATSIYDRKMAAILNPVTATAKYKGTLADVRAMRFTPVKGAGLVRAGGFISTATILDNYGDGRTHDSNFQAESIRAGIYVDFENGVFVSRTNPTCATDGQRCDVADPGVGVVRVKQTSEDRIDTSMISYNPLHPEAQWGGMAVRANLSVTPFGFGVVGTSARGVVSSYPSFELYSDNPDGGLRATLGTTTETWPGVPVGLIPIIMKHVGPEVPNGRPLDPPTTGDKPRPVRVQPGVSIPYMWSYTF